MAKQLLTDNSLELIWVQISPSMFWPMLNITFYVISTCIPFASTYQEVVDEEIGDDEQESVVDDLVLQPWFFIS